jgi:hypothetical protein
VMKFAVAAFLLAVGATMVVSSFGLFRPTLDSYMRAHECSAIFVEDGTILHGQPVSNSIYGHNTLVLRNPVVLKPGQRVPPGGIVLISVGPDLAEYLPLALASHRRYGKAGDYVVSRLMVTIYLVDSRSRLKKLDSAGITYLRAEGR